MEIKIPIYEWVVRFLNGVLAIVMWSVLDPQSFLSCLNSAVLHEISAKPELLVLSVSFAVSYEVGSLFDRLGSFPFESVFKKIKILPFNDDYVLYNSAKVKYPIMTILQKGYAVCRTQFALFITYAIAAFIIKAWSFGWVVFVLSIIEYASWFKFAKKIVALMDSMRN